MSRALPWLAATILLLGLMACQDGGPRSGRGPMMGQALSDSIERGYQQLRQAYSAANDSIPPSLRDMYGAMDRMHGRMMQGHREEMGMQGRQGEGGMHEQRRPRPGPGTRGAEMREWHQQMMVMHTEMAQLNEQSGRADLATRHHRMSRRHGQMMESYSSEGATAESRQPDEGGTRAALDGTTLYEQNCASCHGREGQGFGTFPPLSGASWVNGDEDLPIRILLHGLQGPIEVKDRTYDSVMPAFGGRLRDEEIAAILTYVRSSWGNEAGPIEPKEVRALRDRSAGRTQAWTPSELEETEN